MRIIVDAMGGDNAPGAVVEGAIMAAKELTDVEIVLVGDSTKFTVPEIDNLKVVHAAEVIDFNDDATTSVRTKKDSSIVVGLQMVADKKGDAFVSGGSTGALIVGSSLILKRIKGIRRAALGMVIPTKTRCTLLMDCGANVDCTEEFLQQFAVMGNAYAKAMMGIPEPKIALLNNGTEETKGNQVAKNTYQLLKEMPINFIGNVEAKEALNGVTDVLIADGFSGNIMLKTIEGTAKYFSGELKEMLTKNILTKLCAVILSGGIRKLKEAFNAEKHGGAPILGVDGVVVKAHGSSKANAFYNAIKQAKKFAQEEVVKNIKENL